MNRFNRLLLAWAFFSASVLFAACEPEPFEPDPDLLTGVWKNGTEYYHYYDTPFQYQQYGGSSVEVNGNVWDTSVDEGENEALPFKWTLEGDQLQQIHYDYMGSVVPKTYTVTELSTGSLSYQDNYGRTYSFTKVL